MKCLLFDFGGTLDADGTTWLDRFYPLYKEAGLDIPKARFAKAFYLCDDTLPRRFALPGLSFEKTLRLQVGQVLQELGCDRGELGEAIVRRFLADCRAQFRRNRTILERLRTRFRLGIVSNFYGNLDGVLRSEGLRDLFAAVADSGVIGKTKPDPGIFQRALGELGAGPEDSVMIGDSIPRDMRGAEGLGMAHILIGPQVGPRCCPKAWTAKTLPDIEPLLSEAVAR
ncbi:MAG: HAD family hydrolase [Elusimicrobia bacterium]|nr:HAD family hydrolase [Elusimicrobiota bacterium]